MSRHAEIAGAGFGGLTAAIALLKRGWTVRVHERTPFVRSEGFAVIIHKNALCVMEALGVRDRILKRSIKIHRRVAKDRDGRILRDEPAASRRISRQQIVSVLAEEVQALGGELLTDSEVVGADPSGELILRNGRRLRADLVIGADGYNSRVRDSLGLHFRHQLLDHGAMRLVIPRSIEEREAEPEGCGVGYEYWSGTRRVTLSPCSQDEIYLALTCVNGDEDGMAVPVRIAAWKSSFPHLGDVFDRVSQLRDWDRVKWVRFQTIWLDRWVHGKVAILGDAAHAMPPNLGQGGGCAMMNAHSLAVAIGQDSNLEQALARWERSERPLIDHTQRWVRLYGAVASWPSWLRVLTFDIVTRSGLMQSHFYRAANRVPPGCPSVMNT
jgi:2-polyprenyl-6-methoxyphenol hydroxylase-like FAD-dependent oxidoreductase